MVAGSAGVERTGEGGHLKSCPPTASAAVIALISDEESQHEWPLVISPQLCQRRDLYEAVLKLELTGAVVIERSLGDAAVSLSASACVCFWSEKDAQVWFCSLNRRGLILETLYYKVSFSKLMCVPDEITTTSATVFL